MELRWDPPGPGQWALDRSHMSGSATPLVQELMSRSMPAGMRRTFKELGVPADTLDVAWVNGLMYTRLRPLIGADKPPKKLPPSFILKLAIRLHPEMRRRAKVAGRVMEDRPWRRVLADWESSGRARVEAKNLALQDVDLAALSDTDLVAHVRRVVDHAITHWEMHFWLHGSDMGPIGLLLYETSQWGLDPSEVIPLLEGASPSTSEPIRLLSDLRVAIEESGSTPQTLDDVKAISPEIEAMVAHYLRYKGSLLFSRYDIDGVTLGEVPQVVFATIRAAEKRDVAAEIGHRIAEVRGRVPADHRARFDEVLGEARAAMNLRDDNGPTTAEWPLGLMRLSLLELGRRLAARGRILAAEHIVELRLEEITPDLLDGDRGVPSAADLATRAQRRRDVVFDDAPRLLGPAEVAPPPDVLPASLSRLVGMVQIVIAQMGMDGQVRASGLHGVGVGTSSYSGRARRANSPEEAIDSMEPGDVLVVPCTTPAYNVVLAIAGAVVTSEGGPLSHAAVLARELGIPAVIGAPGALREIPDGAQVEVDPVAGLVTVLGVP